MAITVPNIWSGTVDATLADLIITVSPSAGNTLVVLIASSTQTGLVAGDVTDNKSEVYSNFAFGGNAYQSDNNNGCASSCFYFVNIASGVTSVTVSANNLAGGLCAYVFEVAGLTATPADISVGQANTSSLNITTPSSGTLTQATEIVFIMGCRLNQTNLAISSGPTNGFTGEALLTQNSAAANTAGVFGYQIVSATTALSSVWTMGGSGVTGDTSSGIIVSFKGTTGGTVNPPPPKEFRTAATDLANTKYRANRLARPPFRAARNRIKRLIPDIQPPAAKLGVPPRMIFNTRTTKQEVVIRATRLHNAPFKSLRNKLKRLIPDIQPPAAKLGVPPKLIFNARSTSLEIIVRATRLHNAPFRSLRRFVMKLVRDIQPPAAKLGLLPKLIFTAKTTSLEIVIRATRLHNAPFKATRNRIKRLIPDIQPPAAKLGLLPKLIFNARSTTLEVIVRATRLHNAPSKPARHVAWLNLNWLRKLIQPPAAELGVPPSEIFRAKTEILLITYLKKVASKSPFRLTRRSIRLERDITLPSGILPRQIFRDKTNISTISYLKRLAFKAPFRLTRRSIIRLERVITLPSGVPPRLIFRDKTNLYTTLYDKSISIKAPFKLAKHAAWLSISWLKHLIQPPVSALGVLPRQTFRAKTINAIKNYILNLNAKAPFRLTRRSIKLERDIQPPAAALGVLPRQAFRSKTQLAFKVYLSKLAIKLPFRLTRRSIKLERDITLPSGIPPRLIFRDKTNISTISYLKRLASKSPFRLTRRSIKLERDIQPPAAALGVPPKLIFNAKSTILEVIVRSTRLHNAPFKSVRRFVMKLVRDIQPPAAKLGVPPSEIFRAKANNLLQSYLKNRSFRPPFRSLRRFVMRLLKDMFTAPTNVGVYLPKHHKISKPRVPITPRTRIRTIRLERIVASIPVAFKFKRKQLSKKSIITRSRIRPTVVRMSRFFASATFGVLLKRKPNRAVILDPKAPSHKTISTLLKGAAASSISAFRPKRPKLNITIPVRDNSIRSRTKTIFASALALGFKPRRIVIKKSISQNVRVLKTNIRVRRYVSPLQLPAILPKLLHKFRKPTVPSTLIIPSGKRNTIRKLVSSSVPFIVYKILHAIGFLITTTNVEAPFITVINIKAPLIATGQSLQLVMPLLPID